METNSTDFLLVAFVCLSLLFLKCDPTHPAGNNNMLVCQDDSMSVHIPKELFYGLPSTIYVRGDGSGYYQAAAIAERCRYSLQEMHAFIVLTVAYDGCFVRREKFSASLTVVIVAPADEGPLRVVQSLRLICERRIKEPSVFIFPGDSKQFFCNKNGFNITIPRNATVPPLNLDAVWVASDQKRRCFPQTRSKDAVAFSFPFTECGTQFMIADGNITYWINISGKPHSPGGVIFRQTPFQLTVRCSFALNQITRLGITVQQNESDYLSVLKNKGTLRTEMRFAKDSSYSSFYSSSSRPAGLELGQPVFVEVFVVKHQNKDLTLLLEDCWATPTEDPHDPQRWNLIVKGCPSTGDSQRTVLLPVSSKEKSNPSHHKWFVVKLFSFVKSPASKNQVYFHCNIEICKGPDCFQHCRNGILCHVTRSGPIVAENGSACGSL
ncbi:zona pellucida sperm-binding protein 4 isoform X2 [Kryptolebias marmoratus]|uniref:zona pellucida sperm-binding protein 4 isoform X2 n=1 Tax=Kryptolebias marmoratus TaxID=37003 RepID=UPI0018ACD8D4|nr:zona pellucida sperm-binding protein 4 isoform X2 [Kryptolebias marmoratus]